MISALFFLFLSPFFRLVFDNEAHRIEQTKPALPRVLLRPYRAAVPQAGRSYTSHNDSRPAFVSEKTRRGHLRSSSLSSLPKELGELPGLTKLDLCGNWNLGNAPQDEAFPAELRKMKSLRDLNLAECGLHTVPAFVGELKSLEVLTESLSP